MKNKEIIEKAAEKFYPPKTTDLICSPKLVRDSFIAGAKWQQEQDKKLYNEEEVHAIIESYQNNVENNPNHITYDKWFEKLKKK